MPPMKQCGPPAVDAEPEGSQPWGGSERSAGGSGGSAPVTCSAPLPGIASRSGSRATNRRTPGRLSLAPLGAWALRPACAPIVALRHRRGEGTLPFSPHQHPIDFGARDIHLRHFEGLDRLSFHRFPPSRRPGAGRLCFRLRTGRRHPWLVGMEHFRCASPNGWQGREHRLTGGGPHPRLRGECRPEWERNGRAGEEPPGIRDAADEGPKESRFAEAETKPAALG